MIHVHIKKCTLINSPCKLNPYYFMGYKFDFENTYKYEKHHIHINQQI